MPKQAVYVVVNVYDYEEPATIQLYDNRDAAEQHAANLNAHLGSDEDEDEPVFAVWEEVVLSEFNP